MLCGERPVGSWLLGSVVVLGTQVLGSFDFFTLCFWQFPVYSICLANFNNSFQLGFCLLCSLLILVFRDFRVICGLTVSVLEFEMISFPCFSRDSLHDSRIHQHLREALAFKVLS